MKIQAFWNVKPHRLVNMGFFKLWRREDACQSEQTYPSSALILGLRRAIGQRSVTVDRHGVTSRKIYCIIKTSEFFNSRKLKGTAIHTLHAGKRRMVSCLKTPSNLPKSIMQSTGYVIKRRRARWIWLAPHECTSRAGKFQYFLLIIAEGQVRSQARPRRMSRHWDTFCSGYFAPPPPKIPPTPPKPIHSLSNLFKKKLFFP